MIDDKMSVSIADKDMVDSGVVAQLRTSDRTSVTEEDEGAVSITYDDRYRCVSVSEEDEAVVVDNRSSQEVGMQYGCSFVQRECVMFGMASDETVSTEALFANPALKLDNSI